MTFFKISAWLTLMASMMTLLVMGIIERFSSSLAMAIVLIVLGIMSLFFALLIRHRRPLDEPWQFEKTDFYTFLWVYFPAIMTYNIAMYDAFSSVFASALVGLVGAVLVKKYELPIFCGSFVGMASASLFGAWGFVFAALMAGIVYVFSSRLFRGFGGRAGTIAFSGILISMLMNDLSSAPALSFTLLEGGYLILAGLGGALLTRLLHKTQKVSVVAASAITGLFLSLLFDYETFALSPYIVMVGYGASFVGMSDESLLPSYYWIGIGGALFGILYYLLSGVMNGSGGKLGMMAFITVIILYGIRNGWIRYQEKKQWLITKAD